MQIQYDNNSIEMNEEWSFKNFTNKGDLLEIPNDINIYNTVFSHEEPDSVIFPTKMSGVKFYNCNLDNCVIPKGNTVIGGSQRRFKVQNDLEDWEVDENNLPIKPLNHKVFLKRGFEVPKPEDIPAEKVSEPTDYLKVAEEKLTLTTLK